ncbi:MAG: D-cysteine desulfhydrase family protein [Pseudomonadota bacterium]
MSTLQAPHLPPELADAIAAVPRARFIPWVTPLEPLKRLMAGEGATVFVKRDDLTGIGLGGNKVRKLEFYFGKAVAAGADTVLITGAVQSNYVRIAAACAARLGLNCHVQLEERVAKSDPLYRSNGNVLLDDLFGASRSTFPVGEDEGAADAEVERLAEEMRAAGRTPFVIPLSPNKPPLGSLGYVLAAQELLRQAPDLKHVVVASGSGLTHTGLLFGLKAMGWPGHVHAVCVRRSAEQQRTRIANHCARLADLLGVANPVAAEDIDVDDSNLAPGYGQMNPAIEKAMLETARLEGLVLDPVYTGRVFAAAIAKLRNGTIKPGEPTAIIHTGGIPALFAYESSIREFV